MLDTSSDFERRYTKFAIAPGGSARRRARNPENWEIVRLLVAQIDDGQEVSPQTEANIRGWLQVVEHRERRNDEFDRLSILTIEERFVELGANIEEYVGRPGIMTANRRIEGDRFAQGIKLLSELKDEFPEKNRELMLAALNRYQTTLDTRLHVAPTSDNNPKMRALLDQRIARAAKNLNRVRQVYKNGNTSEKKAARTLRDAAIRSIESLLRVDGAKLNSEQVRIARATLEKLKTIKPPKMAPYAWVKVVPGGLPTMGRGHK